MNDPSYTQTPSERVYPPPGHPRQEPRLEPHSEKVAASVAHPSDQLIGQRYLLRARLGHGRLGDIYEALDEPSRILGIERRVAIQLLDEQVVASRHFADEFERDYRALKAISHPGIAKLLAFGRDGDRHFLVMELIEGASLRFVLDDVTTLPIEEVAGIVRALGDALQHLHAKAIVHGNLRPENVIVTYGYEVKLLDVVPVAGAAESLARTTPDIRDDVYGLACLAYELLAGRHPFNTNTPLEAERAGLELKPVDGLSPRRWRALDGALTLDREHRTPTLAEFLDEFGITGAESLRAAVSSGAALRQAPEPPEPWPVSVVAANRITPQPAKPTGTIVTVLSLLITIGLGAFAFAFYDQLRDGAAELMVAIDAKVRDLSVARPGATAVEPVATLPSGITAPTKEVFEPVPAQRVDPGSTDAPPAIASGTGEPPIRAPRFSFARPLVTVSEGQVAARIVALRSGDTTRPGSVVWWTSENTAIAGEDYADLGRRTEKFAPGEQSRTLYIPLVNDRVVESTKGFNVYLGRDDTAQNQLSQPSGMRVDILDDD